MNYKKILGTLKKARKTICIVGLGGLGSVTAEIIAREDLGDLVLIDDDLIEESNLQRQTLYDEDDIGKNKVIVAKERLNDINPGIRIRFRSTRLNGNNLHILDSDIILDCSDNIDASYLINQYAIEKNIPWVFCTVVGDSGYAKAITRQTACLKCCYKHPAKPETTETAGMLNTCVQLGASIQTRLLRDIIKDRLPDDCLIHFDVWRHKISRVKTEKKPDCEVCGH